MMPGKKQVFLSYSSENEFEAGLLQFALETMLADLDITVWSYQRDQARNQRGIADSLKACIQRSKATIFLVSPHTLAAGAAQWMELAYSDAFGIPTFVLLHHVSFRELKSKKGIPPFLLEVQCNAAVDWKNIFPDLRACLS